MSPYNWLNCTKVVFALYVCIKNYCSKELNDYIHWTKLNNQISGIIRTLRNCILYSSYYDLKKCTISFSTHSLTYQLRKVLLNLIKFNSWCWHIVKLLVNTSHVPSWTPKTQSGGSWTWASKPHKAKNLSKTKQATKQSTQVKSIPLNFDGGLWFGSKARNLAKQSRARK